MLDWQTCSAVHCTLILCKHGHEVASNTTFSCKEHSLLRRVFCIASHGGKVPSLYDNLDTGNVQNGIGMNAQEDQAFSATVITDYRFPLNITHYKKKIQLQNLSMKMAIDCEVKIICGNSNKMAIDCEVEFSFLNLTKVIGSQWNYDTQYQFQNLHYSIWHFKG